MTQGTAAANAVSTGLAAPEGRPRGGGVSRGEWAGLLAILLAFLLINLVTAARAPIAWQDEAMFADPAVNAVSGRGLTSTAWPFQRDTEVWGGNAPLHTWLLVPWLKVFGVNMTAVRSVNFLYAAAAAALLWGAVRRLGLISSPGARLGLVALLLCEHGVSFSYRGGRYDMLGMLWVVAILYAASLGGRRLRLGLMCFFAALLPFTGIQLLAMAAVALPVTLLVLGRRAWPEVLAAGAGVALGTGALAAVLWSLGNISALWTWISTFGPTASGRLGRLWDVIGGALNLSTNPGAMRDYSLLPTVVVAAVCMAAGWRRAAGGGRGDESPAAGSRGGVLCLALATVVPIGLCLVGQFPSYYAWMAALPASLAAVCGVARMRAAGSWKTAAAFSVVLAAAAAVGLPARMVLAAKEWRARDPEVYAAFVKAHVRPEDVAAADYQTFYALHEIGAKAYYEFYFRNLTVEEKGRVSVIIVAPWQAEHFFEAIGGTWREAARFESEQSRLVRTYEAAVYRREPAATARAARE